MSDDIDRPATTDDGLNRHAYLVEQAEDGLYMMDESGEFTVVNEAFVDLTGYGREEIIGNGPELLLEDDDLEEMNTHIRGALRSGESAGAVLTTLIASSGQRKPVEIRFSLLPSEESYNGLTGVVRDVRARRHREQKLDVLSRVLRHNVRNKLNLIFGHAQTIQSAENDQFDTAASQIESAAEELMQLSEKARTAQTEVGFNPSVEGEIDLVELVEHLAVQFRREHPEAEITTAVPEKMVVNAPKSYRIAVSELVENAIEHNPDAIPSVRITLERANHGIVTTVEDGCPPIPDPDLRAINEGQETPLIHSMGIGLWLANWVADTVGGELRLERLPDDSGNRAKIVLRGL